MSTQIPHVLDDPGSLWREYEIRSQPAMVLVSADGSTRRHTGAFGPQRLVEELEALAAGSSS